jgi:chemotaxis protein CheX
MSVLSALDARQVTAIAQEVFGAMIDGETGLLMPWSGATMTVADPLHAWVDLSTVPVSRLMLTTDAGTAEDLTRAFLTMDEGGPVAPADVTDAFGEMANVFGGNVKALLPEYVSLTLPEVSRQSPGGDGAARLVEASLAWRGRPFVVSLWTI